MSAEPLCNRSSAECHQQWVNMGSSWCFENDPSCVVLYLLQLLDAVAWSAVEHSIAVVDPGQDKTTLTTVIAVSNKLFVLSTQFIMLSTFSLGQI